MSNKYMQTSQNTFDTFNRCNISNGIRKELYHVMPDMYDNISCLDTDAILLENPPTRAQMTVRSDYSPNTLIKTKVKRSNEMFTTEEKNRLYVIDITQVMLLTLIIIMITYLTVRDSNQY